MLLLVSAIVLAAAMYEQGESYRTIRKEYHTVYEWTGARYVAEYHTSTANLIGKYSAVTGKIKLLED